MLSAAVLPMLMSAMMTVMDSENRIELIGMGVPITTICGEKESARNGHRSRGLAQLTLRNHGENGRAWSLLRAHAWREAAARALKHVHTLSMSGMQIMQTVPALLLVAARKTSRASQYRRDRGSSRAELALLTSMNGKGDSDDITASILVIQKHWSLAVSIHEYYVSCKVLAYVCDDEDQAHHPV